MSEFASSFEEAWEQFQRRDTLRLAGDTLEWEWSRGRAQYLPFLVRMDAPPVRHHPPALTAPIPALPGTRPFTGMSVLELFRNVARGSYTPPRDLNPAISKDLAAVCERALEVEPEDRYPDGGALAAALAAVLDGDLDELLDALVKAEQAQKLDEALATG